MLSLSAVFMFIFRIWHQKFSLQAHMKRRSGVDLKSQFPDRMTMCHGSIRSIAVCSMRLVGRQTSRRLRPILNVSNIIKLQSPVNNPNMISDTVCTDRHVISIKCGQVCGQVVRAGSDTDVSASRIRRCAAAVCHLHGKCFAESGTAA